MSHHQETVRISGHIIDSLILAKVLDIILMMGGTFELEHVAIGKRRDEPSQARIVVNAATSALLEDILKAIQPHGASVEREFYATTHLPTQVRVAGHWVDVDRVEMDLAVMLDELSGKARTIPMADVRRGDRIVVGREGVRVIPLPRPQKRDVFGFMESQVSAERPHGHVIADVAARVRLLRDRIDQQEAGCKVLLAGGPAIIHSGGREPLTWLI